MVFEEKHKNIVWNPEGRKEDDRECKSCHIYSLKKQALGTDVRRKLGGILYF